MWAWLGSPLPFETDQPGTHQSTTSLPPASHCPPPAIQHSQSQLAQLAQPTQAPQPMHLFVVSMLITASTTNTTPVPCNQCAKPLLFHFDRPSSRACVRRCAIDNTSIFTQHTKRTQLNLFVPTCRPSALHAYADFFRLVCPFHVITN